VSAAVSGGADSLALLGLAARAGLDVVAVHVDHGIRSGSHREAQVVEDAARMFGAAFESRSVEVREGPDLEARARVARYSALPHGVLTGHTMDDQAETVLMNVLRGAALDGLTGMRPDPGGRVRRPIISLRRSETEQLCAAFGLTPVRDPMNEDPRFRRNRVRSEVVPLLCEVAGRDVVPVLARQAANLWGDAEILDELASAIDPTDVRALRQAPVGLARRAVRAWLRTTDTFPDAELHPPSSEEVARVLAVARGGAKACQLSGGRRVERSSGRLRVISGSGG
jgi:tRNA(Ile)-lysidine synthase